MRGLFGLWVKHKLTQLKIEIESTKLCFELLVIFGNSFKNELKNL